MFRRQYWSVSSVHVRVSASWVSSAEQSRVQLFVRLSSQVFNCLLCRAISFYVGQSVLG